MGIDAHWSFQCRLEFVRESFLDAVGPINGTLEFGLQTVYDDEARAVGRPNRIDKVEAVIDSLNARGIPYEVSLIYGLPLQTLDSFRMSVDWCLERGVPRVRAWPLMLLRGTALDFQRECWGYVESVASRIPIVVESFSFSRDDHAEMARIADELYDLGDARQAAD
jgi:histone acetyltransferase (RNA polymerase elongator complex component)